MLDYLIKNATVVDGTGSAAYLASVGVKDDKIFAIYKNYFYLLQLFHIVMI